MIFRLDCHVKVLHCAVKLLGFEAAKIVPFFWPSISYNWLFLWDYTFHTWGYTFHTWAYTFHKWDYTFHTWLYIPYGDIRCFFST